MRTILLSAVFISGAAASVPVRDGCTEDSAIVAHIQESDSIQIAHAVAGEALPCYAVSVLQAGGEVHGFILGNTLAATREFERKREIESRIPLPPPPPAAPSTEQKKTAPPPSTGPPFETWTGIDSSGKRITIAGGVAKVTLVTFWSVENRAARRAAGNLMKIEPEFKRRGLKAYGLVEAPSVARLGYYLDDMGLDYPQAMDRQRTAGKYNADPSKGTTLVIDSSNHIVAISSNPAEIRAAVAKLLPSE